MTIRVAWGLVLAALVLAGCDSGDTPYLKIAGGGFVFNYRIAEATCNVVAEPLRALPEGAVLEGEFENPQGGEALRVTRTPVAPQRRYMLTSPPLHGVQADRPYGVTLRLRDAAGTLLEEHVRAFTSTVDQSVLPKVPLTIGPGYTRNPESFGGVPPAR
ncbi:hypothetical protein [Breoghania sp. L-A4]|uniref:hypothetical protein n=1 Tax=Breoghania sp. L-A4 TaxID=2304600 RepID=UPI000E35FA04|nr:hypothetical protein [Breoghania sp. L-A4]AXS41735.1 hypothetical protein D1F64_19130 [Breoghania sp. L-A4]